MGGSSSTTTIIVHNESPPPNPPCPPPPNFMKRLFDWINAVYGPPITVSGDAGRDAEILKNQIANYTRKQFIASFGYAFAGNDTSPPKSAGDLYGPRDLVNCPADDPDLITQYIKNTIVGNTTLPGELKTKFASDLNTVLTTYLQGETQGWQSSMYFRQYIDDKSNKWHVEVQMVWAATMAVNYSLQNPASKLVLFLYYVGVTYRVKNE
ncbi:hypothetical protein Hte_007813 [Hypoxylon texense]